MPYSGTGRNPASVPNSNDTDQNSTALAKFQLVLPKSSQYRRIPATIVRISLPVIFAVGDFFVQVKYRKIFYFVENIFRQKTFYVETNGS
jgi:hypothetical protein